nr:hypothetical protein [Tanacetum cinerariifolium]
MIAILEKTKHNIDFHLIVDFIKDSHIRVYNFSKMIFDGMVRNVNSKGSKVLMYPRQYSRRATRIAQSKALSPATDEPTSLLRDDSEGEAFPTVTSLDAGQDRENIIKTSALPHESTPMVTFLNADEGSMQQQLQELMDLCTGLQRQQIQMTTKIEAQDLEITGLKERIKLLEDKDRGSVEPSGDAAPIKGRSMKIGEEVGVKRSTELGSNDTEEMVNVLSFMEAANILTSGVAAVNVPPVAGVSTVSVPTVNGLFPLMNEQIARDSEIARIHTEEELKMLIDGLDRSNEVIAKHLQEYEQSEVELTIREKIELINELKFIPVWKQIEDFVPMSSTEEGERMKRKGLKLDQGSAKRMKTSEDVSEEDINRMMQLVHVEEVYVEALQVKHPIIDWDIHSEGNKDYWKIITLGGHTAVYPFFVDMLQ